jgi:hypothetical protein
VPVEQVQETCAFRMVSSGNPASCPRNWICTYDIGGVRTVRDGADGVAFSASAATFRYRPAYYDTEPAALGKSICELFRLDHASEARDSAGVLIPC